MLRTVLILLLGAFLSGLLVGETVVAAGGLISERTHKSLARVHEPMDEGRDEEALERLKAIRSEKKRNRYERALLLQTYGYLYAAKEQYRQAIDALNQCLKLKALPKPATKNALYLLAQLQMTVADYREAVASLEKWFALEKRPAPEAHGLAGAAYAQVKRYTSAGKHLRKAIKLAKEPRETWYQQLLALHSEAKQYQAAARLLEEMIKRFPERKDYWLQLSGVYRELGDETKSLATMELAYRRGLLSSEPELINLANYYLYMELPYKAARLLDEALRDGAVGPTGTNWKLLGDAWLKAREIHLALEAMERAAELSKDPELHLRRAQLAAQRQDWPIVLRAIHAAFELGKPQSRGKAYLLQGIAHFNLQDHQAALASFKHAQEFNDSREQARQWSNYLSAETATLGLGSGQHSFEYASF